LFQQDWLNAAPNVKDLLARDFAGAPLSKQNLHEWPTRQDLFAEAADLTDANGEWVALAANDFKFTLKNGVEFGMMTTALQTELARAMHHGLEPDGSLTFAVKTHSRAAPLAPFVWFVVPIGLNFGVMGRPKVRLHHSIKY
jgi:hypothetical protein